MTIRANRSGNFIETPVHHGFAPIATCHWQGLANILEDRGLRDGNRKLGLSWGSRWSSGHPEVLAGGGRWVGLLRELFGVEVHIHRSPLVRETERMERRLCDGGLPFVAEVDAFYVPSDYQGRRHVVHTVIVLGLDGERATYVDSTYNPRPVSVPVRDYRLMRASPCAGRIEPGKLYVPLTGPSADPAPEEIARAVRSDIAVNAPSHLARLHRFLARYEAGTGVVSVCRTAAERYQAALLFGLLAERGVAGAEATGAALRALSDHWYLIHMLTEHPRARDARQRARIARLVRQAIDAESRLADEFTAP